jgi:hypothetical protein
LVAEGGKLFFGLLLLMGEVLEGNGVVDLRNAVMEHEGDESFSVGCEAGGFTFEFIVDSGEGGASGDGIERGESGG